MLLLIVVLAGAWCCCDLAIPEPSRIPAASEPGDASVAAAKTSTAVQAVHGEPPTREIQRLAPMMETPVTAEHVSDPFPADYHGIRDKNMVVLFSKFKGTIENEARKLSDDRLTGDALSMAKELFCTHSAYVALIQQQRLYYCSYERPKFQMPKSTRDVMYHATGMGGLHVVFELTRAEFPEVFELWEASPWFRARR